jgi:predicted dienelactone hydrolase
MVAMRRRQGPRERPVLVRHQRRIHEFSLTVFVIVVLVTGTIGSVATADTTTTTFAPTTTTTSSTTTTSTVPPTTTTTVVTRPATYSVGITRCTFTDATRSLLDYGTSPPSVLSRRRTLVTEIRYPTSTLAPTNRQLINAPPALKSGGFPAVVFAHGYNVTPDTYAKLLDTWVRRGFVVIAPIFPGEEPAEVARQHANTESDLYNEPADMAFVTRHVLRDTAARNGACPLVAGLVNPERLALAGHSDGAIAVGLLAFSTGRDPQGVAYRNLRSGLNIRSVVVMSGAEDGSAPYSSMAAHSPLLVIQSAHDQCNPSFYGLQIYRDIHQANKWFLELLTAHHLPPIDGEDPTGFSVVASVTTDYLEFSLNGVPSPSVFVAAGDARPRVARIFHAGGGPSIAPFDDPPVCGPH